MLFKAHHRGATRSRLGTACLFTLLITLALFDGYHSEAASQRLVSEVTVVLEQLPEMKQEEMQGFYKILEDYINSTAWIDDDQGGEIPISMRLLLSDMGSSTESRYRATLLISNTKDIQYADKRCLFAYEPGSALYHSDNNPNSLTALLDFYIYLIIGGEFDKYSKFGGTPYFEKAKRCAAQGKFGLGRFVEGWDLREKLILEIMSDSQKSFREMKDTFFLGVYLFDEEEERAKGRRSVYDALIQIEQILKDDPENENCMLFLGAYSTKFIDIFKDIKDKRVFRKLIKLDPERKKVYEAHLN